MPIDHKQPYDPSNILARVISGELPSNVVVDSDHSIAIHDIAPLAPIHVLVIPKGDYVSFEDFATSATDAEIADLVRTIGKAAAETGADAQGYRILANTGKRAGQEIPHLHIHLFGGQPLGPMLAR
ncbi:MAG: HIT domain-containing protein [Pseudomonadota bacterium]